MDEDRRYLVINCPACFGSGKKRDWLSAALFVGIPLLFDADDCRRCDGLGKIKIQVKDLRDG